MGHIKFFRPSWRHREARSPPTLAWPEIITRGSGAIRFRYCAPRWALDVVNDIDPIGLGGRPGCFAPPRWSIAISTNTVPGFIARMVSGADVFGGAWDEDGRDGEVTAPAHGRHFITDVSARSLQAGRPQAWLRVPACALRTDCRSATSLDRRRLPQRQRCRPDMALCSSSAPLGVR
jgi:hypothetical protein